MTEREKEAELFELLSRNNAFKEWLQSRLDGQIKVLVQNVDGVQLHRAQGSSQLLQTMLDLCNRK